MATKKEVTMNLINSDRFLDLPASAQLLMLQFIIRANEFGEISNPCALLRMLNRSLGDLEILIEKNFVYQQGSCIQITAFAQALLAGGLNGQE